MKDNLYYVYSRLSSRFTECFSCATDSLARRRVLHALRNSEISLDEVDLFRFGSFDIETGTVDFIARVRVVIDSPNTITDVEKELEKVSEAQKNEK